MSWDVNQPKLMYAYKIAAPFRVVVLAPFYSDGARFNGHVQLLNSVPKFNYARNRGEMLCITSVQTWAFFCFAPQRSERDGESTVQASICHTNTKYQPDRKMRWRQAMDT